MTNLMKIGVDARTLSENPSGVGNYLKNIIEHGAFDTHTLIAYSYDSTTTTEIDVPRRTELRWKQLSSPVAKALGPAGPIWWMNIALRQAMTYDSIDLFFGPNFLCPVWSREKSVLIVHDMIHRELPTAQPAHYRWYLRTFLALSVNKADHVITVSESTRGDLLNYHNIPRNRVSVAHGAAKQSYKPRDVNNNAETRLQKTYGLPNDFLLYVGNIEPRKNIDTILRALSLLADPPNLVIAGQRHLENEKLQSAYDSFEYKNRVQFTGYVPQSDLPQLYNLATGFIYPSLYEGFGLPVLEAMQSGLPTITSNTSSLPEITDGAAITVNPTDPREVSNAIAQLWYDESVQRRYRKKGLERAKDFSWEQTAIQIAAVLGAV